MDGKALKAFVDKSNKPPMDGVEVLEPAGEEPTEDGVDIDDEGRDWLKGKPDAP